MRTAKVNDKVWVAANIACLQRIGSMPVSYHLARRLEEDGWIEAKFEKEEGQRGRGRKVWVTASKGEKLLKMIENFH